MYARSVQRKLQLLSEITEDINKKELYHVHRSED